METIAIAQSTVTSLSRPPMHVGQAAAPFLPMSRAEMEALGWDQCDVIVVTGDAYVDHPSFGMTIIGRLLEAQGLRVGIISQPDWQSAEPFKALGKPRLFFGVTGGRGFTLFSQSATSLPQPESSGGEACRSQPSVPVGQPMRMWK